MTGLLTQGSAQKIKRAVSNAFKNSVGKDALFMFVIEQQDKDGNPCDPHIHAMANIPFKLGSIPELKRRLQRIAGNDDEGTVKIQTLSQMGQHHNEIAPGEANYRRGAQYDAKNDHTIFYRSRPLMAHVHKHFEELKEHYSQEP